MKIFKYEMPLKNEVSIDMPFGASILDIQYQNNKLVLWAMVTPENELTEFRFKIYGTGHEVDYSPDLIYLNTVQDSMTGCVWHVFEDVS